MFAFLILDLSLELFHSRSGNSLPFYGCLGLPIMFFYTVYILLLHAGTLICYKYTVCPSFSNLTGQVWGKQLGLLLPGRFAQKRATIQALAVTPQVVVFSACALPC